MAVVLRIITDSFHIHDVTVFVTVVVIEFIFALYLVTIVLSFYVFTIFCYFNVHLMYQLHTFTLDTYDLSDIHQILSIFPFYFSSAAYFFPLCIQMHFISQLLYFKYLTISQCISFYIDC